MGGVRSRAERRKLIGNASYTYLPAITALYWCLYRREDIHKGLAEVDHLVAIRAEE